MLGNEDNINQKEEKKNTIVSIILKIIKWIVIIIVSLIALVFIVRAIGQAINNRTPDGGINESMYVDINGTKQWINIYGQDINNPVILYLHGGPGGATSYFDYKFLRKWSDIYTVVTWDQRDAGLTAKMGKKDVPYTYDLFMEDGIQMTRHLLNYLHKDKLILIGHSWGSSYGSNLSLKYPEYYQYYIGTGQLIDMRQNEIAFIDAAKEWSKGDKEGEALVAKMETDIHDNYVEFQSLTSDIMKRYNYHGFAENPDYNLYAALFFNPFYSLSEIYKVITAKEEDPKYMRFLGSPEFNNFSLLNRTEFPIPYYNILGDKDYQTNYLQAEDYFNKVKAPRKKLYVMKNMTHGLMAVRSGEFSDMVHEIAKLEQNSNSTTTIV